MNRAIAAVVFGISPWCGATSAYAQDVRFSFRDADVVAERDLAGPDAPVEFAQQTVELGDRSIRAGTVWLEVAGVRSNPDTKPIRLPVVRLYSEASDPGPPVIYLAGGPGDSSISAINMPHTRGIFLELLETRDIVLADQRGVGRSRPSTIWIAREPLPTDIFLSHEIARAEFRSRHEAAKAALEERGIELGAYTDLEAADDIDAIRRALGVNKVALLGFSYGTHLALATIRQHGDRIDAVVIAGVEGPNDNFKMPSAYDRQLERITEAVRTDPVWSDLIPDMKSAWREIIQQAAEEPLTIEIERRGETVTLPIGPFGLQWIVRRDLGDTNDLPIFPALFYTLGKRDTSILKQYAQRRYNQWGRGVSGMSVMTDISSGGTADRIARIEREAESALFGNAMNFEYFDIRDIWGHPDIGEEYRGPIVSDVRTLFISGTLDCQTPPEQAEDVRDGFANSAHIIVENAGHESTLPHPDVRKIIVEFFRGKPVSDQMLQYHLEFRQPKFASRS